TSAVPVDVSVAFNSTSLFSSSPPSSKSSGLGGCPSVGSSTSVDTVVVDDFLVGMISGRLVVVMLFCTAACLCCSLTARYVTE
ncbi:hypothetical protein PFISCL1PPCAC_3405, partial [Pristionchus fissidentatus]